MARTRCRERLAGRSPLRARQRAPRLATSGTTIAQAAGQQAVCQGPTTGTGGSVAAALVRVAAGHRRDRACGGAGRTDAGLFERLRNIVFDSYQRLAPRDEAGASLAVVDIDEASIAKVGQWPWPRTTIAKLVDQLLAAGAATLHSSPRRRS